ncbi:MAG: hypothetical protein V7749_00935 [Cocleimonas sp.]
MDYIQLSTENEHRLYVCSMSKFHQITHLVFNDQGHKTLMDKKQLVCVAHFPNINSVQAMAHRYEGDCLIKLQNKSCESKPYSDFYMKTYDGKFFQIAGIFTDVNQANQFMTVRDDAALIDSTNFKDVDKQYHFIACLEPSKKVV